MRNTGFVSFRSLLSGLRKTIMELPPKTANGTANGTANYHLGLPPPERVL